MRATFPIALVSAFKISIASLSPSMLNLAPADFMLGEFRVMSSWLDMGLMSKYLRFGFPCLAYFTWKDHTDNLRSIATMMPAAIATLLAPKPRQRRKISGGLVHRSYNLGGGHRTVIWAAAHDIDVVVNKYGSAVARNLETDVHYHTG